MSEDIYNGVKKYLAKSLENVDVKNIQPSSDLRKELNLDSLQSITMVMDLEKEFDIQVADEEIPKLITVQDIVDLIKLKKSAS